MFRLSVIVVLVASIFVGRTSPLTQNEEHESKMFTNLKSANTTQSTDTVSNDKKMDLSIKATVVKKDLDLKTMNNESNILVNLINTNVSTPIDENNRDKEKLNNEKQKCNSDTEEADMLDCNVIPRDNDGDESLNTTEPTIHNATTANNEIKSSTKSQVPEVTPHEEEENGTGIKIDVLNNTQTTNQVPYDIALANINHTINTDSSDVSSTNLKHSINETSPLLVKKAATNSENIAGVAKSVSRNNSKHMPSGIIALVTAISFAVAIALVYIGMIVWRRYIEYRYGHRELLVNELEFDTNDLRHFEL